MKRKPKNASSELAVPIFAKWTNIVANVNAFKHESFAELRTKAALSALTGEVLAIGYGMSGSIRVECQDQHRGVTERDLLTFLLAGSDKGPP
jgi:hypothetical protein